MPFKKFWNLAPDNKDAATLNMYVYGEIKSASSFFGSEDNVVASEFVADLNAYPDVNIINVYINSPGGSVFAAAAIRNQLRKHPANIHTWCDGICASAAVGILLAADLKNRHMSRATMLMIHNPSTKAEGTQADFIKAADLLAKVKKTILDIYQEGTGLSLERLSAMMDNDTYLDADEALSMNFIGQITEDTVIYDFKNEGILVCNGISMDVAAHLNIEQLKNHLQELANKQTSATSILNEGGSELMDFDAILNSLPEDQRGILQAAIDTKIQAALQEKITALVTENETALQALRDTNAELTTSVSDLQAQVATLTQAQDSKDPDDIKDLPAEAQALIAQARADAIAAQTQLAELQAVQAYEEFKGTLKDFSNLPLKDTHIKALQNMAKNNQDLYPDMCELLKVANTAMGAGFKANGTNHGTEVEGDAYGIIDQRVKSYQEEHKDASYNEALRAVLAADPNLYESYRDTIYRAGQTN